MNQNDMPIVYGPVKSRRFGQSLGINLLGQSQKICSFDCVYCHLGPTELRMNQIKKNDSFTAVDDLRQAVPTAFQSAHASTTKIDIIMISGNGEPTLHPEFDDAVKYLKEARDLHLPKTPIGVLTNGAHLDSRKVIDALNSIEMSVVKFDVGGDSLLKSFNAPLIRTSISKLIRDVRPLKNLVVQSLFVGGQPDNSTSQAIDDWIEVIGMIKPKEVQIHGMNRTPAYPGLKALDEDSLYTIASRLERRTQIRALVFI